MEYPEVDRVATKMHTSLNGQNEMKEEKLKKLVQSKKRLTLIRKNKRLTRL